MKRTMTHSLPYSVAAVMLFGALGFSVKAAAQSKRLVPPDIEETAEEAELPDIDAIEKGARPRASVSFGGATKPAAPQDMAEPESQSAGQGTVNVTVGAGQETSSPHLEGTAEGLTPPGGVFGVDNEGWVPPDAPTAHAAAVPELHVVKKGDTLWDLCEFYFRDPWRWPRLWAQNPLITNPHWIFPGDVIRLRGAGTSDRPPATVAGGSGSGLRITSNRAGSLDSNAFVLRRTGYVEAKDLAAAAVISGSREEKILLSSGDQAYLSFDKDKPLRAGERYTIFIADTENPIRAPETGAILGYLVRIYGDVVVDQVADQKSARGLLVDLVDPIERGYLVSPVVRQFRRVEPRPSAVTVEARIVASFTPIRMLSGEHFVVLSRGKRDGVEVGNRTYVVRRGDGYRGVMEAWDFFDPRFPKEVVGELFVVDVAEKTSVAWIARSTKEIRVGEITELRKGY